jgi:S1-C subfamily serine protease
MKRLLTVGALLITLCSAARAVAVPDVDPSRAIVKLYVTTVARDLLAPWRSASSYGVMGSGVLIADGRILTAAHVVNDQTFVQLRPNGAARKYRARVMFVSHVTDLALLEVDDPAFHQGMTRLELGELPAVRAQVAAYGFPNGGETLSITSGIVARVEHWPYGHSWERLLALQMDAAIAPGSSGGPVVENGRLVGIAMQGFKESAIGCAVPAPVIRQFLADAADGRLDGVPDVALELQKLENATLKASLRVPAGESGALVRRVFAGPGAGVLREGDVLLTLGGMAVGDDGTVEIRPRERTDVRYATDLLQVGARVPVSYLREGRVCHGQLTLGRARGEGSLVPRIFDRGADYYVFGGLAFVSLTRNLLDLGKDWVPAPIAALARLEPDDERDEVVLLIDVLSSEVNAGYSEERWQVVDGVDGRRVRNLRALVHAVEASASAPGRFVSFDLSNGYKVTVDRKEALASASEVLGRYGIASDRSARLGLLSEGPAVAGGPVALADDASAGGR